MSDVEDMDIDEQPTAITFSSDLKGKKMSKANLPISAGDTLPWLVHTSAVQIS
jgi:replication factor C subunit 3/5